MCRVRKVKYIFHFTRTSCVFSPCLFPFEVSNVVVLILPMSFCVQQELRQPKDLRQNKSIPIILPTQGKEHVVQGLSRRSDSLIHFHGLPWQLYTALKRNLSESNSSSVLSVYQPYNHNASGSFGVYGGHSRLC